MQLTGRLVASIKRILNLNAPVTDIDAQDDAAHEATTPADGAVWKVLVFDEMGRDVISSVLRVNDLRGSGVWHAVIYSAGYILSARAGHNTSEHRHNATLDSRCMWHNALEIGPR
jgi:hypothetical protein